MAELAWLGIDLGTQSVHVAAIDDDGATIETVTRALTSTTRSDGRHEQDPDEWWECSSSALLEITALLTTRGFKPMGVAISATSGTIVPISADGNPIGRAVMYDDLRGASAVERVAEHGHAIWDRLGYRMQASWALPTIVAMIDNGELSPKAHIAHQPDIVASRLTGTRVATDTSHALKTGADLDAARWPSDVFHSLELDERRLPELALPGEILGTVSPVAARETGLPLGMPVIAGMTDGCAAQIASGALRPGDWNSVLGTTLVLKGVAAERRPDPITGSVYAHRAPFDEGWWPGGASSSGAGMLSTMLPGRDLDALGAAAAAADDPERMDAWYPIVGSGERFPFVHPGAAAVRHASASDAETLIGIGAGVASVERLSLDLLDLLGYDTTGVLSSTGGGARSTWWVQLRADLLGREILVPEHRDGAVGMAMLAAAGVDGGRDLTTRSRGPRLQSRLVEPRDSGRALLLDRHRRWLDDLESRGWLAPELADHSRERLS